MDKPLTSSEQTKVIFFWIGLTALIGAGGIGILLIFFTLWGLYMTRKYSNFEYLETVSKFHKVCALLVSLGLLIFSGYLWIIWKDSESSVSFLAIAAIVFPLYTYLFNYLFYEPINNHKEWVVANGIFSTTVAEKKEPRTTPLITLPTFSFKKSSDLSIPDELVKLNKLKDDELITQEEFDKLRKDLLG